MEHPLLLLTHGAGGDRNAPLLRGIEEELHSAGVDVLRFDLPFRAARPHGPPRPNEAEGDRAGLRQKILELKAQATRRFFVGGSSYGGRQASMLLSEEPSLADGLLLLSYPLHRPGKPRQLRTAHLPSLRTPALFIHGSRDPFGSLDEIEEATKLIPARTHVVRIEGAGHDLKGAAAAAAAAFVEFFISAVR